MDVLNGGFCNTLDEKGRLSFPAKLRSALQQNELIVTQGLDHCLMLFTCSEWENFAGQIIGKVSVFDPQKRMVMRRIIAPAQKIEFDKSGRLSIPQGLRDYASLSCGSECHILSMGKFMELWDSAEYKKYNESNEPLFQEAVASMSDILL